MTTVLIVGGGISGPVTAMALQRRGIDARIFEAYESTADGIGLFLTVAVNGQRALRAIDLLDLVREYGFDCPRFEFYSGTGKSLGGADSAPGSTDGLTSRTIKRADLYRVLRDEALRRGIPIEYGKRLVAARTESHGVTATFADGTSARGDLLVGADGLLSATRNILDPHAPKLRYVPLLNTGGFINVETAAGLRVGAPGVMHMYFGRKAFYCHMPNPNGEIWWFANVPQTPELDRAALAAITPPQWRTRLATTFGMDRTPAHAVIAATTNIAPPWNTYDFPTVPTWHNDRIVLVGDAAHAVAPTSGQGASMAIEDGVALANRLADHADIPSALTAYEKMRRDRVEAIVADGAKKSGTKMPNSFGRVIRDAVLPMVFAREARRPSSGWILDYVVD